jgi:hypothetical protein
MLPRQDENNHHRHVLNKSQNLKVSSSDECNETPEGKSKHRPMTSMESVPKERPKRSISMRSVVSSKTTDDAGRRVKPKRSASLRCVTENKASETDAPKEKPKLCSSSRSSVAMVKTAETIAPKEKPKRCMSMTSATSNNKTTDDVGPKKEKPKRSISLRCVTEDKAGKTDAPKEKPKRGSSSSSSVAMVKTAETIAPKEKPKRSMSMRSATSNKKTTDDVGPKKEKPKRSISLRCAKEDMPTDTAPKDVSKPGSSSSSPTTMVNSVDAVYKEKPKRSISMRSVASNIKTMGDAGTKQKSKRSISLRSVVSDETECDTEGQVKKVRSKVLIHPKSAYLKSVLDSVTQARFKTDKKEKEKHQRKSSKHHHHGINKDETEKADTSSSSMLSDVDSFIGCSDNDDEDTAEEMKLLLKKLRKVIRLKEEILTKFNGSKRQAHEDKMYQQLSKKEIKYQSKLDLMLEDRTAHQKQHHPPKPQEEDRPKEGHIAGSYKKECWDVKEKDAELEKEEEMVLPPSPSGPTKNKSSIPKKKKRSASLSCDWGDLSALRDRAREAFHETQAELSRERQQRLLAEQDRNFISIEQWAKQVQDQVNATMTENGEDVLRCMEEFQTMKQRLREIDKQLKAKARAATAGAGYVDLESDEEVQALIQEHIALTAKDKSRQGDYVQFCMIDQEKRGLAN